MPVVGGALAKRAVAALPKRDKVPLWMSATLRFCKANFAHARMYDPWTGELLAELFGSSALCHHITDRPQLFIERARAEAMRKLDSMPVASGGGHGPADVIARLESVVMPFVVKKYGEQMHFLDWCVRSVGAFEAWLDRDGNREQLRAQLESGSSTNFLRFLARKLNFSYNFSYFEPIWQSYRHQYISLCDRHF